MKAPVPSLSLNGWVSNPREALDLLVSYFFLTNASQSNIYRGEVSSAQEIIQRNANDTQAAASELGVALNRLLRKHYVETFISVEHRLDDASKSSSVVQFILSGTVTDNGVTYQLSKLVETKDGAFLKFVEINNG